jgi:hypothetical protein
MSRMTSKKRSQGDAQGEVLCCSPKVFVEVVSLSWHSTIRNAAGSIAAM